MVERGAVVLIGPVQTQNARRRLGGDAHLVLGDEVRGNISNSVVLRVRAGNAWRSRLGGRSESRAAHARPDAADPVVEVGDPVRLAELAVADDVDPRLGLARDDVGDPDLSVSA